MSKYYKAPQRRYAKKRYALRRAFFDWLKSLPCADCGREYPSYVMDFDHTRGAKRYNVAAMTLKSWPQILQELEKCDVVCANCHKVRTHVRRGG